MPLYFSEVAPTCPLSTDSATGANGRYFNSKPRTHRNTTLPIVHDNDLTSAIRVANLARALVTAVTKDMVKNNVYQAKGGGQAKFIPDKFKNKTSRWVEQKDKRIKKKYKYYGKTPEGEKDKLIWVIMERIERMVWYDKAWKAYLIWEYGDKGEGEPVGANKPAEEST